MPSPVVPKALEPGATIAFVSPSARLNDKYPAVMARATALLEGRGYKVREFYTKDSGIQNGIANRLAELRAALTDDSIGAVICTIGGTTFTELLPALLADTALHEEIRARPKIVVGYSDITGLHWFLHATTGLRTFYGPGAIPELGEATATAKGKEEEGEESAVAFSARSLFRAITSRSPTGDVEKSRTYMPKLAPYFFPGGSEDALGEMALNDPGWSWIRPGKARGRLFGGCLTVMARLGGVRGIAPDWRGRIVFVETAPADDGIGGNPLPRVRAGFADLMAQGVFDDAAGLVIGRPFGYDTPAQREEYAGVIRGLLCEGPMVEKKQFPILFNVDFGHTSPLVTLPFDVMAELDSEVDRFAIVEAGVL
ncbi:putative peptidase u61 ld-carboxypeptidase a [Rosellinia necatrix]|uniref:Putative peptidase u61 ld-carboxypeptidase a n=1 Tax=Rosellinia necatrix TaxID=77044 RepID=A0A1W2TRZ3_ROSNE|nr:putative peptidase u61 ld-carboxypeptidase a [Rosellinia necatrix]